MGGPSLRPQAGSSLCQQLPPSSLSPVHFHLSFPCRYKHCDATPRAVQCSSAIIWRPAATSKVTGQECFCPHPVRNLSPLSLYLVLWRKVVIKCIPTLHYLLFHLMLCLFFFYNTGISPKKLHSLINVTALLDLYGKIQLCGSPFINWSLTKCLASSPLHSSIQHTLTSSTLSPPVLSSPSAYSLLPAHSHLQHTPTSSTLSSPAHSSPPALSLPEYK